MANGWLWLKHLTICPKRMCRTAAERLFAS